MTTPAVSKSHFMQCKLMSLFIKFIITKATLNKKCNKTVSLFVVHVDICFVGIIVFCGVFHKGVYWFLRWEV